jgi:C-terminal processing protease CtpA/Prc
MSSNESFIAMMGELPQVTLMGVSTAGSSGNPKVIEAGADVQVRVPQWIDYRPDGKPLDEIGIDPDVVFAAKAGAFAGNRDDLLAAALERLQPTAAPTSKPKDTNGGVQATP